MNDQLEQARLMRCRHDWPVYHLKHLARLTGGGTPAKENSAFWEGGDVPWISPKDMKRRVITSAEDYITEDAVDGSATSFVDAGSPLMVVRSGILRHTLPVAIAGRRLTLNQDMKAFNLSSRLNPMFFVYWVEGQSSDLLLEWRQFGATVESIDTGRLLNGRLALPDLPTQKEIADFLDRETARIDQLIEWKQRMVEVLGEKRQAVISRAVTKGLDADVPMKDSGVVWLGDIPVHWDVKQLRRAIMFQRGHDLPTDEREEGEVVIVSSSGVSSTHSRAIAKAPSIVTGRYGTIGQFHLINQDYWPLNTTLYSINLYGNEPRFLLYMLAHMSPQFLAHAVKSAVPGVDRKDVHADHVAVPPISEQRAIAVFLDRETVRIDTLVTKIRETIDRLREFRSALITAAVTGHRLDQIEEATNT